MHHLHYMSDRDHIRENFSVVFLGHHLVRRFVNQVFQREILHFVCNCLDYHSLLLVLLTPNAVCI